MSELTHNSYFENQVQSVAFARHGRKSSIGVIVPGQFHFGTDAAERMTIVSGECRMQRDGSKEIITYPAGTYFEVAAHNGFTISCAETVAYLCEYI